MSLPVLGPAVWSLLHSQSVYQTDGHTGKPPPNMADKDPILLRRLPYPIQFTVSGEEGLQVLRDHGFSINRAKSQLIPTTRTCHLGAIDTVKNKVYLSQE